MKASTFPIAVLIFSLVVVGMVGIFTSANPSNYSTITGDPTGQFEVFNEVDEIYQDINTTYTSVEGTSGTDTENTFFLSNLNDIWTSLKQLWKLFSYGISNSTEISEALGIPPVIRLVLLGVAILSLTILLLSAVIRWRLD